MQYAIIGSSDIAELEFRIQQFVRDGWVPQGGLAITTWIGRQDIREYWILQAIVHPTKSWDDPPLPNESAPGADV